MNDLCGEFEEERHSLPTAASKERRSKGISYLCPFAPSCSLKQSRFADHIRRHHRDLLHMSERQGGGGIKSLITKIKLYTQEHRPQPANTKQCFVCKLYVHKRSLLKHLLVHHGINQADAKQHRKEVAREEVVAELQHEANADNTRYVDCMLEDFEIFLKNFGGGTKADTTARAAALALNNVLLKAGLEATILSNKLIALDIIAEANRQRLDLFLTSEVQRVKCGFRNTVTALCHFHRFINSRKQSEIAMANLQSSLSSFASSLDGWRDSAKKIKKATNAESRDALDRNYQDMVESGRVAELFKFLDGDLRARATAAMDTDHASPAIALYLQAQICFGKGKCCDAAVLKHISL